MIIKLSEERFLAQQGRQEALTCSFRLALSAATENSSLLKH